ncbi:HAD family hydrolase [Leptolyngbya sp. AN02str]|uniref:HAD family hydrolase n=1 Tax=Leptolyngbya sp. AN02str TaxID=3423363 RepID=UPI003D321563
MSYRAIATDYDGTVATDGLLEEETLHALARWRDAGKQLILITGRRLDDFLEVCPQPDLFDRVVAENGAALYRPHDQSVQLFGERPPDEFIQQLRDRLQTTTDSITMQDEFRQLMRDRSVDVAVGRVIVATWEPHDRVAQQLIDDMNLDLDIILNKGAVMLLPPGVNKVSGLQATLAELELEPSTVVGVGDAENDIDFIQACGYGVAVANALPSVKAIAHHVTESARGAGVVELIHHLLSQSK